MNSRIGMVVGVILLAVVAARAEPPKPAEELAKFADGVARAKADGRKVLAVRVRPAADLNHPLAIREITIESEPAVAVFKYPVEFVVNVDDAPEMKEWAEKAARVCERKDRKSVV